MELDRRRRVHNSAQADSLGTLADYLNEQGIITDEIRFS